MLRAASEKFLLGYVALYLCTVFMSLSRISGYGDSAWTIHVISVFFIVLLSAHIFIERLRCIKSRPLELLFFLGIIVLSVCIGIINNNNILFVITDTLYPIFALITLAYYSYYSIKPQTIQKISSWILWAHIAVILFGYILFYSGKVSHPSFASQALIIPFAWYLQTKQNRSAVYTFIVILAGVKVSVILAALVIFALFYLNSNKGTLKSLVHIIFFLILFAIFYNNLGDDSIIAYKLNYYIQMFTNLFFSENNLTIDEIHSIRFLETYYALHDFFKSGYLTLLFGNGAGNEYMIILREDEISYMHNSHFSPATILTRYGGIGFLFFTMLIVLQIFRSYKIIKVNQNLSNIHCFSFYIIIGFLIVSLTAFSFFANLLFWVFLGQLRFHDLRHKLISKRLLCVE